MTKAITHLANGDRLSDSRKYGRPKDPRLVLEMAEKVAEARRRWESRGLSVKLTKDGSRRKRTGSPPKVQLSFDEMLDALLDTCTRYSHIAVAVGVTTERIRQIHRDYFSDVLPYHHGTGYKRQRACTLASRKRARSSIAPSGHAAEFQQAAAKHGITAAPIMRGARSSRPHGDYRTVLANGHRVRVRVSLIPGFTNARSIVRYFRLHTHTKVNAGFTAVWCGAPHDSWFIFPTSLIPRPMFYIPERPNTYWMNAHLKQTDWIWQYKEAWHLLKEEK